VRAPRVPVALAVGSVGGTLHPCEGNAWRPTKLENAQLASTESLFSARGVLLPLLTVVRPLVYQSNSFHYCHSTREVCRGGLVHCRKAFPACGCICFLHSNNNVPQSLALACRVLPCSRAYFRSNWIVSLSVSMGVGDGAAQQRIKESSATAVALF
jgi:hypothetical protein